MSKAPKSKYASARPRPDSLRQRALAVLRTANIETGYALTLPEWRAAFALAYPGETIRLDSISGALKRVGLVVTPSETARLRSFQYRAVDTDVPARPVRDVYSLTADVVLSLCRTSGTAVSLDVIRARLHEDGVDLGSDEARWVLETLCTEAAGRATPEQTKAKLQKLTLKEPSWGRERCFWRPVGTEWPAPVDAPLSKAAALRMGICAATAELGLAPSLWELKAWGAAHPEHPASSIVAAGATVKRPAALLRNLLARRASELACEDVSSEHATDGGVPLRLGPVALGDDQRRLGTWADLVYSLRPHRELAASRRLHEEAASLQNPALARLAETRLAAVLRKVEQVVGVSLDDREEWRRIEASAAAMSELLARWSQACTRSRRPEYARAAVSERAKEVERASSAFADLELPHLPDAQPITLVGNAGLVSLATATEWLGEVLRPQGRPCSAPRSHLAAVRRFPNVAVPTGPLDRRPRVAYSLLDVGDTLVAVANLTERPAIAVVLREAADLLGSGVRDRGLLETYLLQLPREESAYRDGAVVALGALGSVPAPELVLRGSDDRAGLDAYALALGVSPSAPDARAGALMRLWDVVDVALRAWLDEMVARAESGSTVSIPY